MEVTLDAQEPLGCLSRNHFTLFLSPDDLCVAITLCVFLSRKVNNIT